MTVVVQKGPDWTPSQRKALEDFSRFLQGADLRMTFVLRGAAGTGKSTLIRELVARASARGLRAVLLAPTGRAARVLRERTGCDTATIHSAIYTLRDVIEQADESEQPVFQFELKASEEPTNTVFFVDEASMVGDEEVHDTNLRFGSGRLLKDIVEYIFWAHPDPYRKLVLIGDHCQLSPVHAATSPALDPVYLRDTLRLVIQEATLKEIVRQDPGSALVAAITQLREAIETQQYHTLQWHAESRMSLYNDTGPFSQAIRDRFSSGRIPHLICYKNATVRDWNRWVRESLLHRKPDPEVGDRLIVLKNHYQSGLMNGDFVTIRSVGEQRNRSVRGVTLTYREVTARFIVPEGERDWTGLMLENALLSPERHLNDEEEQARWILFKIDHPKLRPGTPEFKEALLNNKFWNCLIPKYGYATTCHKAQGGEWDEVFVVCDFGPQHGLRSAATFRWLYTAVTRARQTLHLLNAPQLSAADGLLNPAPIVTNEPSFQPTAPASHPKVVSVEESIESVIAEAANRSGLGMPRFMRLQHTIKADWTTKTGLLCLDTVYNGKGEITGATWRLPKEIIEPPFNQPELEARFWSRTALSDVAGCPPGIRGVLERVASSAKVSGLVVRWKLGPFVVQFIAMDENAMHEGVCKVRASYNNKGAFTSSVLQSGSQSLFARLEAVFQGAVKA
jgi:hypothetical protein